MRISKVMVGLDFSEPSIAAATWVSRYFAPDAELILAHVIELAPPPPFGRTSEDRSHMIEATIRDFAATRLHDITTFLSAQKPQTEIRVGRPYEVLASLAETCGADLIVVGPHGDRDHSWLPLGTTAERLVRTSPVPVLVVKNARQAVPAEVLVPVDDSSVTPTLLGWTKELAETFDASVTLLHVLSTAAYSHVASMSRAENPHDDDAAERVVDESLRDEGIRWLEEMGRTGVQRERVSAAVTYGKPGEAVVTMATEMGADLVVLGRRGRGQVLPALLGSTVRTVLSGASCPVLVVTEPTDDNGKDSV
jgi:nucleotide-binding universal stress UspA family protein